MKKKKKRSSEVFIAVCAALGAIAGVVSGGYDGSDDFFIWPIITTGLTVLITAIVMAVIEARKTKKSRTEQQRIKEEELKNLDTEKLDSIVSAVKARTAQTAYSIKCEKCESIALTDSKFGGLPYWPKNKPYPENEKGEKLVLLAQINFDKAKMHDYRLPKHGILQFFILGDELSGADFNSPTSQNNFRVVYHAETDSSISEEYVRSLDVKANTEYNGDKDNYLPSYDVFKHSFEEINDSLNNCDDGIDALVGDILEDLYDEKLIEGSVWKSFNSTEFDYLASRLDNTAWGHKMLGYPAFTQSDPRNDEYQTLLLQIDSQDDFMWGDCGVANFFINEKDLRKLDFSKVLYTWDCY